MKKIISALFILALSSIALADTKLSPQCMKAIKQMAEKEANKNIGDAGERYIANLKELGYAGHGKFHVPLYNVDCNDKETFFVTVRFTGQNNNGGLYCESENITYEAGGGSVSSNCHD